MIRFCITSRPGSLSSDSLLSRETSRQLGKSVNFAWNTCRLVRPISTIFIDSELYFLRRGNFVRPLVKDIAVEVKTTELFQEKGS